MEEDKKAEDAEFEVSLEGLTDEEKEAKRTEKDSSSKNNTEVEVALKAERERREKAEHELEETRKKARERMEKKRQEGTSDDDEDVPVTRKAMREMLEEERESSRKELRETRALELAQAVTKSDSKKTELVLEVWKNRTLAGSLEEQIEEAYAIATHKETRAKNEELKRALAGKETTITTGENAQRKSFSGGEPTINATDKTVLEGYTWDNAKGAYRKVIAGGTRIFFVSKDFQKRWTEEMPKK